MESGALAMDSSAAPDPTVHPDRNIACLRRRAWAQSRDSVWQEPEPEQCRPQGPQQHQVEGEEQRPADGSGQVPNKITSWLIECRTPLGASLDDQSASPSKGALRNGCSFEDDLSLGAEANHLHSSHTKTEPCFGLAAHHKRNRYKEGGRSMNSTGSGKSSTVSSVSEVLEQSEAHPEEIPLTLRVSELLDLYEEDPEEILLNLGFGREEPDLASRVPSRFINNASSARGIDIKVYLGAQLQRMELENPNYALTSRFRQIEVLTTVANEFFQLYSQVSGQPLQRITSKDQGEGIEAGGGGGGPGGGGGGAEPVLKRNHSALNAAKLLKKTISKHNLLAAASESPEAHTPHQHTQLNGHAPSEHTNTNGHAHTGPDQDGCSTDPDHQPEMINQKHSRKKDSRSLATVTEETSGDGETEDSPEQSSTGPAANGVLPPESADSLSTGQRTNKGAQAVKEEDEEKNMTSTPEKAPPALAPLQVAKLRTENADSFDMEEIQSNEDEALPHRPTRNNDLLRTVSQQSDSSGFAEEPSADSNGYLKVQDSSDSCDSETTVTSHPSQDVATPLAMDQPAFNLPEGIEEEAGPGGAVETDMSSQGDQDAESSESIPPYTSHHIPRSLGMQQDESQDKELAESGDHPDPEPEPEKTHSVSAAEQEPRPQSEVTTHQSASQHEPEHTQTQAQTTMDTEPATIRADAERNQEDHLFLDDPCIPLPPAPTSPVHSALNRARQHQLSRKGQQVNPQSSKTPQLSGRGRGRGRGSIPLQRSSSLPCSLLSPSTVVSSVRIQFGRGQASCTVPKYSFKYTQESEGDDERGEYEDEKENKEDEVEGQTNCLSTLIINPGSKKKPRVPTETPIPPKPIPRYLMRSSYSLQSPSPPPDWPPGGHAQSWSTQSVPDLSSSQQQQPGQFQQNMGVSQNQQSWNPCHVAFSYPNSNPNATGQCLRPSPNSSPRLNPSPYPYVMNPSPLQPYGSLPNLLHHHNPSSIHHSSLTNLHQPATPTIPQHGSFSNLHQPPTSTAPDHGSLGNLHPGTPIMNHQGYSHLYSQQSPYHSTPYGVQFTSPYHGFHGYNMNPHMAFPHPVSHSPLLAPEHSLHPGLAPPAPGFLSGMASTLGPAHILQPGLSPPAPSTTEMQLRKVLHEIRGTVQSLSQSRTGTPDVFSQQRGTLPSHQALAEFQQKRRSLNLFRSQMMDLELSIIRQQALVYKHLSPADRLEMEQLQSLRAAVREELQELEQQLEDKLLELTHNAQYRDLHRDGSMDNLSTASALRAMEPVSDLLREQLFLQSEISLSGNAPSTNPSSRSSSPDRGEGGDQEQRQSVYRASINITPVPPPRPNAHTEEEGKEEEETARGGGGGTPEVEEATGAVGADNLQQLIREIRESVAREVRREIYNELLASMSPRQSQLPARQHPL